MASTKDFIVKNGLVVSAQGSYQSTSTTTGAIVTPGGVGIGGNLYVGGMIVADTLSITNTLVQTDDQIITSNATQAYNTYSGAVQVSGGVGIGGDLYASNLHAVNNFTASSGQIAGAEIVSTATFSTVLGSALETVTYIPYFITQNPAQVPVPAVGTTTTYGTYNFGTLTDIQTFGDYNTATNTGFYSVNDAAGAPAHVEYIGWTGITKFNRVTLNINYTQSSGHTIDMDLYNFEQDSWDTLAIYSGSPGWQQFALGVIDDVPYLSNTGTAVLRIYHVSTGNTAHRTWIDYVALEQSTTGGQGPRGATGATGATGAQGVNTGTTATFVISNTTSATSTNTGALQVYGGVGIGGDLFVGGNITANQLTIQYTTVTTTIVETDDIILTYNTTSATNTYSGALRISGGAGIGGSLYAGAVFDQGNRAVTSVTPNTGVGIGITSITSNGTATSFTISNYGVTALATNGAGLAVSASTGSLTLTNVGVTQLTGSTYLGVSQSTGSVTLTNLGVQTLTAGTGTVVSSNTGTITVWSSDTLQTITDRGFTTTNRIVITNTASNNASTLSNALTVQGGIGVQGAVYINGGISAAFGAMNIQGGTGSFGSGGGAANVTYSFGNGTVSSGFTKTINIATGAAAGSTSTISVGPSLGTGTVIFQSGTIVQVLNTTASTSTNTGALTVAGGLGVNGAAYFGSTLFASSVLTANSGLTAFGTINLNAGSGGGSNLTIGGTAAIGVLTVGQSTVTQVTNFQAGATVAGYTKTINFATNGTAGSTTTVAIGPALGTGTVAFQAGTIVQLANTTNATSPTTGALTVSGGAGIGQDLYVGGNITAGGSVTVAGSTVFNGVGTSVDTTTVVLDAFANTLYRSAKYLVSVSNVTTNKFQTSEILLVQNGTNAYMEVTSVFSSGDNIMSFGASVTSGNVLFTGQGTDANNVVKVQATYITI